MPRFKTILIDPPWPEAKSGTYNGIAKNGGRSRHEKPRKLPYRSMSLEAIAALPIGDLADDGCHLWLWTTNRFILKVEPLVLGWGFKPMTPVTWSKPSGYGHYFVHLTEHLIFGYKKPCKFKKRYAPNFYFDEFAEDVEMPEDGAEPFGEEYPWGRPSGHSRKPDESLSLIETVSFGPYLEIFARPRPNYSDPEGLTRPGWTLVGDEIDGCPVQESLASLVADINGPWPVDLIQDKKGALHEAR